MKTKLPVVFIGHGSPMLAIENNDLTHSIAKVGKEIGKVLGILSISAHWFTRGLFVQKSENPKQIYDMYGFPPELYEVKYPAKGSEALSENVLELLGDNVSIDNSWGIDHGSWAVLKHMYPKAPYPVVQLSVNALASPSELLNIGSKLKKLRYDGWLILGSGNIVHNLRMLIWDFDGGTDMAISFDDWVKQSILNRDFMSLMQYKSRNDALYSVPTPDHFYPLFYVLGAVENDDNVQVFNNICTMGSLSMTSYLFY